MNFYHDGSYVDISTLSHFFISISLLHNALNDSYDHKVLSANFYSLTSHDDKQHKIFPL